MEVKCFNKTLALTRATKSLFFALKNVHLKLARTKNHVTFLKRCRRNNITPKFLFLKFPFHTKKSERRRREFARTLLQDLLQDQKAKLNFLLQDESYLRCQLFSQCNLEDWETIWDYIITISDHEFCKVKQRQLIKFDKLIEFSTYSDHDKNFNNRIVNLSKRPLDKHESSLLNKGLNFIPFSSSTSNLQLATEVEYAFRNHSCIPDGLTSTLDNVNFYQKDNLSKEERKALYRLKKDNSICIIQSDKGKNVVILDKTDYDNKMDTIVYSDAYIKVNKDPSHGIEKQIRCIVRDMKKKSSENNQKQLPKLLGYNSRNPTIYGVPKTHKPETPLRPIVTSYGSVFEAAAKFISTVLHFYLDQSDNHFSVSNSREVINNISHLNLNDNYILVSFDIINMFGSLDPDRCKLVILNHTSADANFESRFYISHSHFAEILDICLKQPFFEYKNEFFIQKIGIPMGSPCSPTVAEFYLRCLETRISALPEFHNIPLWNRYIDDIVSIWYGTLRQLSLFLTKLNKMDDTIKFTMEVEKDRSLPFLDIRLTKTEDGITTSVYNKPMDAGIVLNYSSYQHPSIKRNTVLGEARRYQDLSHNKKEALEHLKERLINNGYPRHLLQCLLNKPTAPSQTKTKNPQDRNLLILPFMGSRSAKISKVIKKSNTRLIHKNNKSLAAIFSTTYKNKTNKPTNVVYEIPCSCGRSYIGETSQNLSERIKQHKYAVKTLDLNNGIAAHASENDHPILWDQVKILAQETNTFKRKIKESFYIKLKNPQLNLNNGYNIKANWSNGFLKQ